MDKIEIIELLEEMINFFPSCYLGTDTDQVVSLWGKVFKDVEAGIVRRAMVSCSLGRDKAPQLTSIINKIAEYKKNYDDACKRLEYFSKPIYEKCKNCKVETYMDTLEKCGAVLCPRSEEWKKSKLEAQVCLQHILMLNNTGTSIQYLQSTEKTEQDL